MHMYVEKQSNLRKKLASTIYCISTESLKSEFPIALFIWLQFIESAAIYFIVGELMDKEFEFFFKRLTKVFPQNCEPVQKVVNACLWSRNVA